MHEELLGRVPDLVAADAAFYSAGNEAAAEEQGVKRVAGPEPVDQKRGAQAAAKEEMVQNGQRWRTGCEGRISV